jgi:hypothetical protein
VSASAFSGVLFVGTNFLNLKAWSVTLDDIQRETKDESNSCRSQHP